jgi:hypothetical protein
MDARQLLQVFSATYHQDPQVRGQAEAQLEEVGSSSVLCLYACSHSQ